MSLDTATRTDTASPAVSTPSPRSASAFLRGRTGDARLLVNAVRLVLVVAWLGSWELAARTVIDPFYYSMPSRIWTRLVDWFTNGTSQGSIWANIGITLEEAVLGFAIGTAAGVVLGVVLGRSRFLAEVLAPFIKGANAIPRIVLASLFVIWFGLGMSSKVATAFVLVFFAVFFNAFQGAREVDRNLIANARLLGASRWRVTRDVVLPSAFTWILASLHISFGFALIGALVGEILGANQGLGLLIRSSQNNFDMNGVLAGMVLVAVVALTAEGLITLLERRLLRWRPPQTHGGAAVE